MKRYGNIFEKIIDMDNLKLAHINAKRDKTYYFEVKMVDKNPEYYLTKIQNMLVNKTYKTSKYKTFIKNDKGKEREIFKLPYFPDRIIHWAIMLQIEHVFIKTFSNHSHASIKNRGIHSAFKQLDKYLKDKDNTKYCLKIDVKKFFPNIDHKILKEMLRRKFKDPDLLIFYR